MKTPPKKLIGYGFECSCCGGLLIAREGEGEEYYRIYLSKTIAQLAASDHGNLPILEVEINIVPKK